METRIHRNCVYYETGRSASTVWFVPHHALNGVYGVGYSCSVDNWNAGNLFARA